MLCKWNKNDNNDNIVNNIVGISLGNGNICMALKNKVISNNYGKQVTPSYISFKNKETLFGHFAKNELKNNPKNTIFNLHQLIGKKFDNIDVKKYPFKIIGDDNRDLLIKVMYKRKDKSFNIQQIYAMILQFVLNNTANRHIVQHAIISVPIHFTCRQRQRIKDAAKIANLNVIRIIDDSDAAISAYNIDCYGTPQKVIIFDFGATSLNVILSEIDDGINDNLDYIQNRELCGNGIDQIIFNYVIKQLQIQNKNKLNIPHNLLNECIIAKHRLSLLETTDIEMNNYKISLTRKIFEHLCSSYFDKCIQQIDYLLNKHNLNHTDIHHIVLCGGCSEIPNIRKRIQFYFSGNYHRTYYQHIVGDQVCAIGASKIAETFSKNRVYNGINVYGVTLNIGIETECGIMTSMLKRGSGLPEEVSMLFTTKKDYQNGVLIKIYEGERVFVCDNYFLGEFEFIFNDNEMSSQLRGVQQIEVVMKLDTNYVLTVIARDRDDIYNKSKIIIDIPSVSGHHSNNLIFRSKAKQRANLNIKNAKKYLIEDVERYKALQNKLDLKQFSYQIKNRLNKVIGYVDKILDSSYHYNNNNEYEKKQQDLEDTLMKIIMNEKKEMNFEPGPGIPLIDDID